MFPRRVLCGIQPSSVPHIGNYLGAIKKWIDLQNSGDNLIVMLADLHTVTIPREPDVLRKSVLETAASLIACGIDPKRSIIYRQSDLYHHTQLAWLLGTLTTVQKVGHIPTYKSKVKDDASIPLGLFLYPVLQTADILLFKTTHLPIGEDQIPHLQLCTYMIEKFYHYFQKNIFPVPQMMATETNRIRSLRHPEQKMSKSDFEERARIDIMDDEQIIQERVMKALTDFTAQITYDRETRPGVSNLIDIYAGITGQSAESIVSEAQRDNLNTGAFKKRLAQIIIEHFRPKRVEYLKLMNDRSYLLSILDDGRARASEIADKTLTEIEKMNAFETELGVLPEIARAVDEMGWLLPTDVQGEAIPMILGGGDVLMAAETGSGKTGAFCLPILQIVHETLRDIQEGNKGPRTSKSASVVSDVVQLSFYDRSHGLAIDSDGLTCQSRDQRMWNGARSTKGVKGKGRYYFEVTPTDTNGIVRMGWSVPAAQLDLGTDNQGFGYGGTGKKSFAKQFDDYGETYGVNDTVGSLIDLDQMKIRYFKNGKDLGHAFDIPAPLQGNTFFAHVCLKACDAQANFGAQPFRATPANAVPIANAPKECLVESQVKGIGSNATAKQRPPNAPLAIIMEPSRELAQQTLNQIQAFQKYLDNPRVRELVIIGGVSVGEQTRILRQGIDIIVATPGRLEELISGGEIDLTHMRFFILDEADGLLSQGYKDLIMKLHQKMPSVTVDGKRLQMIVCSATLHNFEVKKLADSVMHFPTWVDLKGQDAVPETVHHVVCIVDPKKNTLWRGLRHHIKTDDVHLNDQLNYQSDAKETLSEATKILKGEYCLHAIDKFKMDKALIFCRTKLDCDNLERYFIKQGGGPKANKHRLSCVCLHSDRTPDERQNNLQRFKNNEVRFLICTDVAARGIDVSGLPFVINMTLPDEKESYIHRIGRVGRAERMGLAISFVSTVPEKVWYHTCPSKGKNCHNTKLVDQHGCCKWYTEMTYLSDIEEHLGVTISQTDEKMDVPVDEFDGKVIYGERRKQDVSISKGHVDTLAPTVQELVALEKRVQTSFFTLRNSRNLMTTS